MFRLYALCASVAIFAAAQDRLPMFTVGSATAAAGQKAAGVIPVPAGVDAGTAIPVVIVHGTRPGPVLAIAAGSHGTEYASIIAVEQLISVLNPSEIAGTVILLPIINLPSFLRNGD